MRKWFILPDGSKHKISDVIGGKVLDAFKFAPMPYYQLCAGENPYTGPLGVTRLLNGTRAAFLQYSVDYAVDVDDCAFLALGIGAHNIMEESADDGAETNLEWEGIRGRDDLLQTKILTDYKVLGAFSVKKNIGIVADGEEPKLDEHGEPCLYKRNGRRGSKVWTAGDVMMQKKYIRDISKADMFDYQMQLNMYRIMHEAQGDQVEEMRLFIIARDGGMQAAKEQGVRRRIYYPIIPKLPDEQVTGYFFEKRDRLKYYLDEAAELRAETSNPKEFVEEAIKREVMPPVCNERETWGGRKCRDYCTVRDACALCGDSPARKADHETKSNWRDF